MNWQPIASAPASRHVVVWDGRSWYKAIWIRRMSGVLVWCYGTSSVPVKVEPTHWAEITPPTEPAK